MFVHRTNKLLVRSKGVGSYHIFISKQSSVDIFSYYGPSLMESRIPLKPVLEGVRIVALSTSTHEQTQ